MSRRALITGITGQDGPYLAQHLLSLGYDVAGMVRGQNNARRPEIEAMLPGVQLIEADLLDGGSLIRMLTDVQPDEIYHLAAHRRWTRATTELIGATTALGTERLLESIRIAAGASASTTTMLGPRMFCAASHEMFGSARRVVDEHTPPAPETPDGIASAYAYATAARYRREFGMHIARGITFEHVSPRCEPSSPLRSIARVIADLRRTGGGDVVIDMAATSDIGSAHDYVRAMHLALTHSVAGDYIISSGASQTLGDVALAMWRAAGIRSGRILDTGAGVPHGPIASPKKAMLVLGWQPRATLADIAADLIETESAGAAPVTVASPARRRVSWAARPALEHEAEDTLADRARAA